MCGVPIQKVCAVSPHLLAPCSENMCGAPPSLKSEWETLGGGTLHRKSVYREGGTPHIFSEQGANRGGGDTAHTA